MLTLDKILSGYRIAHHTKQTQQASHGAKKLQAALWIALLAATVVLSLRGFNAFQVGTYRDDSLYVILARSLVESDKYGLINVPGLEPERVAFPFGFPLLLTPFALLFPDKPALMSLLSLAATLLNASILFWGWSWFSRRSRWWGLGVTALYLMMPVVMAHSRMVMSEPVFLTFSLLAFILTEQAARRQEKRWHPALMGVVLTFVPFTRTIGVVFVAAIFAYLLFRRGVRYWPQLTLTTATMAAVVSLVVWWTPVQARDLLPLDYFNRPDATMLTAGGAVSLPETPEQAGQPNPTSTVARLKTLVQDYLIDGGNQHLGEDLRDAVLPFGGGERERRLSRQVGLPGLPIFIGYTTFGIIAIGYWRWLRQEGLSIFNLSGMFYFGALFLWVWEGPRLLYPIQPQLEFGLLLGLERLLIAASKIIRLSPRQRATAMATGVSLLIVIAMVKNIPVDNSRWHAGDLQERSAWLKANTPPTAVIMSEVPQIDFLYGERKTVPPPFYFRISTAEALEAYLLQQGVDYILVAPEVQWLPEYTPIYSEKMTELLPLLADLVANCRIRLVFIRDTELLAIYQVNQAELEKTSKQENVCG